MCTRGLAARNWATWPVLWAERLSAMQCRSKPGGVWSTRSARKATKFSERVESVTHPATPPWWTWRPANNTAVPWRRYSNSRLAGIPGTAGRDGLTRLLACMPDFSSTDHTTAFSGGFRYSPHTSAALAQKSGSWLVIQLSTCHGLRSRFLQIRHAWDAEIGTPWAAMASARASIVQRLAPPGGCSVTVLTNNNTSSWPYTHGRPGRSSSPSPANPRSLYRPRHNPTWL